MKKLTLLILATALCSVVDGWAQKQILPDFHADPSAHDWGDGRYWIYPSTDEPGSTSWAQMKRWSCYSSTDLVNWRDEGQILSPQGAKFMITFHMILAEDVESYLPLWHDKIAETNQKLESETTLSRNYNLVILHPEIYEQIREGVEKEYETSFSKIIYCSLNNLNEKLLKLLLT